MQICILLNAKCAFFPLFLYCTFSMGLHTLQKSSSIVVEEKSAVLDFKISCGGILK